MEDYIHYILHVTGATDVTLQEQVQELWSGYGSIYRLQLKGAQFPTAIVKMIKPPLSSSHPRGWNTSFGNKRKLKSYEIESNWYKYYNSFKSEETDFPKLYGQMTKGNLRLLIIEDLMGNGYKTKEEGLSSSEIQHVLAWLARFHAEFMRENPEHLWEVGTYWHLDTRPEELERMSDQSLKINASRFDQLLNTCKYQTIVHGDAKQANFAFRKDGNIAAYDFQYVGGGCGMKDVIYFLSSCLSSTQMYDGAMEYLDGYFSELKNALADKFTTPEIDELEKEWRSMYAVAWADFARFLDGWSPGHYKMNEYVKEQTKEAIDSIN